MTTDEQVQAFDDMGRKAIIARKALDEYFEARRRDLFDKIGEVKE